MERLKMKITTQEEQQGDREEVARYLSQTLTVCPPPLFHPHLTLPYVPPTVCLCCFLLTSRQYHEALESYKNMVQQIKPLKGFVKCLNQVMNQRQQVYIDLRK